LATDTKNGGNWREGNPNNQKIFFQSLGNPCSWKDERRSGAFVKKKKNIDKREKGGQSQPTFATKQGEVIQGNTGSSKEKNGGGIAGRGGKEKILGAPGGTEWKSFSGDLGWVEVGNWPTEGEKVHGKALVWRCR